MTKQTPAEWLRTNWPIVCGVCASLLLASQVIFQLGAVEAQFKHSVDEATDQRVEMNHAHDALEGRIQLHEERAAHEKTAIRLERMETNQEIMSRDIKRVQNQLDSIAGDIRLTIRKVYDETDD